VATARTVDRTAEEFADILCSDPEWVDLEFAEIVAGLRNAPQTTAEQAWPPEHDPSHSGGRDRRLPSGWIGSTPSRSSIRSPPSVSAG
jgi:hypothetical protein